MARRRRWLTHHPRTAAHCLRCTRPQIPLLKFLRSWSDPDSTDARSVCRVLVAAVPELEEGCCVA